MNEDGDEDGRLFEMGREPRHCSMHRAPQSAQYRCIGKLVVSGIEFDLVVVRELATRPHETTTADPEIAIIDPFHFCLAK
jgi:hypothetical protein